MRNLRFISIILSLLIAIPAWAQQPIKVGLIVPLSGPWARQGQVMRAAAELAIEQINAGGGIQAHGNAPLELVVFDAGDSVERAKNAAQRMVAEEPDLVGATGAYLSSFTLAVTEVTERAQIPMLTLSYSDLVTSRGFDYIFQTSATGAYQSENALPLLMDMAESASGERPKTIGIVMDNTAASVAFVSPITEGNALEEFGLELVVNEVFTPPLSNATPLIQRVRSRRPDLLLLLPTAVSDAKLLIEKMNEFGLGRGRLPTISNGSAMGDPDLAANMPPALLEGVMSIVANWSTSGQEQMINDYMDFSGEPWMTQNPLCAFGHIWLLKEALELVETVDSVAVKDALHSMDITSGASDYFAGGRVRFDETGKRQDAGILVIQWQDGQPRTVYPESAALGNIIWPSR
ncbi:MAG: ABC transporter substrate-binding protein [Gammaproteobacteria bacterium]|nr:ABC transporter substrate-binding protein [Gammaproteobacteria bacterium]MBT6043198.1 ABC transporter substrate-binding protein [Gammaproteobacteria bacterium]